MRFWELGNKDVINCKNGHRLGCVGDLEIDVCRFCITDIYWKEIGISDSGWSSNPSGS